MRKNRPLPQPLVAIVIDTGLPGVLFSLSFPIFPCVLFRISELRKVGSRWRTVCESEHRIASSVPQECLQ